MPLFSQTVVDSFDRRFGELERRILLLENANLQVQVAVMQSQLDSILKMMWLLIGAAVPNSIYMLWQLAGKLPIKRNGADK